MSSGGNGPSPSSAGYRPGASSTAAPLLVAPNLASSTSSPFLSSESAEAEFLRSPRAACLASSQSVAVQAGHNAKKAAQAAVAAAVATSSLIDEMREGHRRVCGTCPPACSAVMSSVARKEQELENASLSSCSFLASPSPSRDVLGPPLPLSPSSHSLPQPHTLSLSPVSPRDLPLHPPSSSPSCSDCLSSPNDPALSLPSSSSRCAHSMCLKCSPERGALVEELAKKTAALREEMTSRFQEELAEERRRVTVELERQRQHLIHHEEELRLLHCQVRASAQQNSPCPSVSRKLLGAKGSRTGARLGAISTVTGVAAGTKRKVVVVSSQTGVRTRAVENATASSGLVEKHSGTGAETQRGSPALVGDVQPSSALPNSETEKPAAEHDEEEMMMQAGLAAGGTGTAPCGRAPFRGADKGAEPARAKDPVAGSRPDEKHPEDRLAPGGLLERRDVGGLPSQSSATVAGQLHRTERDEGKGDSSKEETEKKAGRDTVSRGLPDSSNRSRIRTDLKQTNDMFRRGVSILSNYVMKQKIGCGTWGDVFIAVERASGLQRAVKRISKRSSKAMKHAEDEMVLLQRLDHPNIIKVYECYEDYSYVYIVMELCRGGDLYDTILRRACFRASAAGLPPSLSQMPAPQAESSLRPPFDEIGTAVLMHQILSAVHYCHCRAIAHRDIKPENFLLTNPNSFQLKLIDFGLARSFLYDPDELPSGSRRQHSAQKAAPPSFEDDTGGGRGFSSSSPVESSPTSPASGRHFSEQDGGDPSEAGGACSPPAEGRESDEARERERRREVAKEERGAREGEEGVQLLPRDGVGDFQASVTGQGTGTSDSKKDVVYEDRCGIGGGHAVWRRGYAEAPHHRLVRPLHSLVGTMHFAAPEILSLSVKDLFGVEPRSRRNPNKEEQPLVEKTRQNADEQRKEGKATASCSYLPRRRDEKEGNNEEGNESWKKDTVGGSLVEKKLQCMVGYDGRYADSWSCGVLLYLLLSGDLPFNGDSDVEVLRQMLRGAPVFSGEVWQDVSAVAKDLIVRLLTVPPSARLLPGEALQHPFFHLFLPHTVPLRLYASPSVLPRCPSFPSFPASSTRADSPAPLHRALPLASPIMHLSAPAPLNFCTCRSQCCFQLCPLLGPGSSCLVGHRRFFTSSSLVPVQEVHTSPSRCRGGGQSQSVSGACRGLESAAGRVAVCSLRRCRSESSVCCTCCRVRDRTRKKPSVGCEARARQQELVCTRFPLFSRGFLGDFPVVPRTSPYTPGGWPPGSADRSSLTHQLSRISVDTSSQPSPRGGDDEEFPDLVPVVGDSAQHPCTPHSGGTGFVSCPQTGSVGAQMMRSVATFKAHRQALPPCASVPHLLGLGVAGQSGGGDVGAPDSQPAARGKKKGRKKDCASEAAALISRILTEDNSSVLTAPSASVRGGDLPEGPASFLYLTGGGGESQRRLTLPKGERELSETNLAQHEWQQTHEDIAEGIGDGGDAIALATAYICWCRAPAGRRREADPHTQQWSVSGELSTTGHKEEGAGVGEDESFLCQGTGTQGRPNTSGTEEKGKKTQSEVWKGREEQENRRGSDGSCESGQSGAEQDTSDCSSEVSEVRTEAEQEEPLPPAVSAAFSFPAVAVPPVFHPRSAQLRSSGPLAVLVSAPSSPKSDFPGSQAADAVSTVASVNGRTCPVNGAGRDRSTSASSNDSATDDLLGAGGVASSAVVAAALQFQQPCSPFFPLGEMLDPPPVVTGGRAVASQNQALVYSPRTTTAAAAAAGRSLKTPNLAFSRPPTQAVESLQAAETLSAASRPQGKGTVDPNVGSAGPSPASASGMSAAPAVTHPLSGSIVSSAGQRHEGGPERGQTGPTTGGHQQKPTPVDWPWRSPAVPEASALHPTAAQVGAEAAAATLMAIGGVYVDPRSVRLPAPDADGLETCKERERGLAAPVLRLPQHPLSSILSARSRRFSGRWMSPRQCSEARREENAAPEKRSEPVVCGVSGMEAVSSLPDCLDGLRRRQEQELSYLLCFPIPHIHVPRAVPAETASDSDVLRRQENAARNSASGAGNASAAIAPQLWLLSPQDVKLFPFCPLAPVLIQRWMMYSRKSLLQKKCAMLVVEMARGDLANAALTASGVGSVSAMLGGGGAFRHSNSSVAANAVGRRLSFSHSLYGSSRSLVFPAEKVEGSDCAMEQLQRLEGLFLLLDGDGDGLLTLGELVTGVQRLSLLLRVKLKVDRERKKEAQNLLRLRTERLAEVASEVNAAEAVLLRQKEFLLSCKKFASSKCSTASDAVKHKGRASILGECSAGKSEGDRGGVVRPRELGPFRFAEEGRKEGSPGEPGQGVSAGQEQQPDRVRTERRRRRMSLLKLCGEEAGLAQVEACLRECDVNKDGVVDLTEFLTACADERLFVRQELLRAAFRKLDRGGCGVVSVEEVKSALGWDDDIAVVEEIKATKSRCVLGQKVQCNGHEQAAAEKEPGSVDEDVHFTLEDFVACLQAS